MKKTINIYGHYGSNNHGNEAIVRGFAELFFDYNINLYSFNKDTDIKFGLDKIVNVKDFGVDLNRYSLKNIVAGMFFRLTGKERLRDYFKYQNFFNEIKKGDVFCLEAGDQYFENEQLLKFYYWINKNIKKRGGKMIFFLGSLPADKINGLIKDLDIYSKIIVRESISYNALLNTELRSKLIYCPCCAFLMKPEETELPQIFDKRKVVGLTFGFLSQNKEKYNNMLLRNCVLLIKYILRKTDYNIALIPHVNVAKELSDYYFLKEMLNNNAFDESRISMLPENSANIQKYIISKCDLYLTVRTHVSIAAFSMLVPAVVLSYSQKSKGISKDIFNSVDQYTIDIEKMDNNEQTLIESFQWLTANCDQFRKYLNKRIPEYMKPLEEIKRIITKEYYHD